jgi:hypothetical protein
VHLVGFIIKKCVSYLTRQLATYLIFYLFSELTSQLVIYKIFSPTHALFYTILYSLLSYVKIP